MDVSSLSPPASPLDNAGAAQWLRTLVAQHPTAAWSHAQWCQTLESSKPADLVGSVHHMVEWMNNNALWTHINGVTTLTLAGVAVGISRPTERLNTEQAWEQAKILRDHIAWLNAAPAEHAPMRVADVLLFGGMTKPQQSSHGDLDGIILFEPKEEGAYSRAEKTLGALGLEHVLRPEGSTLPSFRIAARNWLGQIQPFISLDDQLRTMEVLLEQDPGFACYSLMGKTWTAADLERTTADDDAWLVMMALQAGERNSEARDYVAAQIEKLEPPHADPDVIARNMDDRTGLDTGRVRWWQHLDRPGLRAASRINTDGLKSLNEHHNYKKPQP